MYNDFSDCKIINDRIELENNKDIKMLLNNKVVFITGGGGSIGRELCVKLLQYNIKKIIIFDINELLLFNMSNDFSEEIKKGYIELILGSILDCTLLEHIFQLHQPNIVIHAAAYKHVSVADKNPSEAIKCNVLGTLNMLNTSMLFCVKHFVYLSSDKAVNPSSIMGATKRIGEILVKYYNSITTNYYSIVRFGNVFGSSGSVSQIFTEQIIARKKITITHPNMERFFMSLSDAANLIISSIALYREGNIFICDMKQSIKITDLAKKITTMLGINEQEIEIQYTSIREGESLFEELCYSSEILRESSIEDVLICVADDECNYITEKVYDLMQHLYTEDLIDYIHRIVPEYNIQKKNHVVQAELSRIS